MQQRGGARALDLRAVAAARRVALDGRELLLLGQRQDLDVEQEPEAHELPQKPRVGRARHIAERQQIDLGRLPSGEGAVRAGLQEAL